MDTSCFSAFDITKFDVFDGIGSLVAYSTETIKFISSPLYLVRLGLISFISGSSLFLASVCRWVHEAKYNFHYGVVKTKLYYPVIIITVVKTI